MMCLSITLLPQPLGPSTTVVWPFGKSRSIPRSTGTRPNDLRSLTSRMIGLGAGESCEALAVMGAGNDLSDWSERSAAGALRLDAGPAVEGPEEDGCTSCRMIMGPIIVGMKRQVHTTTPYEGKLFSVQVLKYADDQGRGVTREVVRHPGAVLVVP